MGSSSYIRRGRVLKVEGPVVNERTGFCKRRIHLKPTNGKVFFPEFHYGKMALLEGVREGDMVEIVFNIWGSGTKMINNVVVDSLRKLHHSKNKGEAR